jgi:adenosylcobinamide kinase/adenosylcobinamide-phosphate guanylyltransferase
MGCKTLFIGGIRSGKSKNAELYILERSKLKPIYLATNEFFDKEMQERVIHHKKQRGDRFHTIEEPLNIFKVLKNKNTYILLECISMWINNMLYHNLKEEDIFKELKYILELDLDIVFVVNDVSCSIISEKKLVRKYVNINGRVAQLLASECDEVFHTIAGISTKIK